MYHAQGRWLEGKRFCLLISINFLSVRNGFCLLTLSVRKGFSLLLVLSVMVRKDEILSTISKRKEWIFILSSKRKELIFSSKHAVYLTVASSAIPEVRNRKVCEPYFFVPVSDGKYHCFSNRSAVRSVLSETH